MSDSPTPLPDLESDSDVKSGFMASLRTLLLLFGISVFLWIFGFAIFVTHIKNMTDQLPENVQNTDAVVVLTGGSERVSTGIMLLNVHLGKKLFISGVHQGTSLDQVLSTQAVDPTLRACCIILGYAAESTKGNADEVKLWMDLEKYHSLRLVTANYHMPRSSLIFNAAMPDVKIIPYPVMPDGIKLDHWWTYPGTISLLMTEYVKFIMAYISVAVGRG